MQDLSLSIDNMSCGGCARSVKAALSKLPGVTVKDVQVGSAEVSLDPGAITPDAVLQALAQAGFPATPRRTPGHDTTAGPGLDPKAGP